MVELENQFSYGMFLGLIQGYYLDIPKTSTAVVCTVTKLNLTLEFQFQNLIVL